MYRGDWGKAWLGEWLLQSLFFFFSGWEEWQIFLAPPTFLFVCLLHFSKRIKEEKIWNACVDKNKFQISYEEFLYCFCSLTSLNISKYHLTQTVERKKLWFPPGDYETENGNFVVILPFQTVLPCIF